jgi:hypothetical protein
VASEKQIAANRRNASRSTGPRSRGGKQRAGRNAHHHGLSVPMGTSAALASELDTRARKIVRDAKRNPEDIIAFAHACAAADAELDLARVRRARLAVIERVRAFGAAERPEPLRTVAEARRILNAFDRGTLIVPVDPMETMPAQEPDRTAEAVRRALPDLLKLDRYERRASARRDRAVQNLVVDRNVSKLRPMNDRRCRSRRSPLRQVEES